MYFKLATRNLKKSIKDYSIYFLTLVFGVCIFYTFNSIESQGMMMELNDMQANAFAMTNIVMGVASVFISFILGFLIVYANNYLIKRRKKEFGIYMTLGMENKSLSRIIFVETMIIGFISLAVGIVFGVLLSQGLSIFTAKMFKVQLTEFKFIFSNSAFIKTIACFGIIYLVVLVFNSFSIRKVKLIDLLTSARKNEKVKVKNIWVSVIIFLISVAMIGAAYYIVLKYGIAVFGASLYIPVVLGAVGTFLFFFSLSGFLLKVVQSNKKYYLRDLNMFVLRQINSKINTTFISMSFICLMLFVAICTFSGGMGINKALNADIQDLSQFDTTFWNFSGNDIKTSLDELNLDIDNITSEYVGYTNYNSEVKYSEFLSSKALEANKSHYPIFVDENIQAIKLSDFNKILKMLGKEKISLKENEYAVFGDIKPLMEYLQEAVDNNTKININGRELTPAKIKALDITAYNAMIKSNLCTFIVNDDLIEGLTPINAFLNLNYKGDKEAVETEIFDAVRKNYKNDDINNRSYYLTKDELLANTAGVGVMISYLAIYMGFIFLITSAAVLALQQLCESADNTYRYDLLKKVGVDDNIINKSLLAQIGIYFMMPLSLAIVHSIVGLKISQDIVTIFGDGSMMKYIIATIGILILVYGGYFIATYNGAKKIIKS